MAPKPIGRFYELQEEVKVPEPYVLTSKIRIPMPTREQMIEVRAATNQEAADRAFLGTHADAVFELYKTRPETEWDAFIADLLQHFFGKGADDAGKSEPSST